MPIAAPQLTQEQKQAAGLVVPGPAPKVDPLWLAIAAGDLHAEGRLFMPSPTDIPEALSPEPMSQRKQQGFEELLTHDEPMEKIMVHDEMLSRIGIHKGKIKPIREGKGETLG